MCAHDSDRLLAAINRTDEIHAESVKGKEGMEQLNNSLVLMKYVLRKFALRQVTVLGEGVLCIPSKQVGHL